MIVGSAAAQIAFLQAPPIVHGSTSWASAPSGNCPQLGLTDPALRCSQVAFSPGTPIGVGFSVRNDGPVPMTIVSVASVGAEAPSVLAELHPALLPTGVPLVIDGMRPFAPIDVAPGDEAMVYLVGRMRSCDAVRGHWSPGTGVRFDGARITVRWLLLSTEVQLPLRSALQVDAPEEPRCPAS